MELELDGRVRQGQIGQAALVVAMHAVCGLLAYGAGNGARSRLENDHDRFGGNLSSRHLERGTNGDEQIFEQHQFYTSIRTTIQTYYYSAFVL